MSATPSDFQRVFDQAIVSTTTLTNLINSQPDFWLENLKALQLAYSGLFTTNSNLTTKNTKLAERIDALEGVDKELTSARKLIAAGNNALNQALGAHTVYKDQNAKLTRQLQLAQLLNLNLAAAPVPQQARPSSNHPDLDKFNGDKTKLEAFVTQLRIKLQ